MCLDDDELDGWVDVDAADADFKEPDAYTDQQSHHIDKDSPITEMEAFQLMFNHEWFRKVKAETNRYASYAKLKHKGNLGQ